MKHIKLFEGFDTEVNESRYTRFAQTDDQEDAINTIERWLKKLGKSVVGSTTIGKRPQTVILDLTHQGSELRINSNGFEDTDGGYPGVEVYGKHIETDQDFEDFKDAIENRD